MASRRLFVERLESRRLLAVYTVNFAGGPHPAEDMLSFHEALTAANGTPEPDVIEFDPALAGSAIPLGGFYGDSRFVEYDLTIRGLGSDQMTFTPGQNVEFVGFVSLANVSHFTISGVTFAPAASSVTARIRTLVENSIGELLLDDVVAVGVTGDAIVANDGTVTLVDVRLVGDQGSPSGQGGWGVTGFQNPESVRVERSEVSGFKRGGIRAAGDVAIIDSTISDNGALSFSSGVLSTGGQVDVLRSTINGNTGGLTGGGVSARWGVTIIESTISENTAIRGGGILTQNGPMTILRSTIRDNTATGNGAGYGGGGALKEGMIGTVVVAQSTFDGNRVMTSSGGNANGGGLMSRVAVDVTDSTFVDNHTSHQFSAGGAIYAQGGSIARSLFENNSVAGRDSDGGAVWASNDLTIDRTTFRNNSTNGQDGDGGAVHMSDGVISNSTFVGNQTLAADSDGGAIANFGRAPFSPTQLVIINTTIVDNATLGANSDGGGVFRYSGLLSVRFSTIAGNRVQHATGRGGGVAIGDPADPTWSPPGFWNSIISDNTSPGGSPDLFLISPDGTVFSSYSLIEDPAGLTPSHLVQFNIGPGNLVGVDPMLGPLADNGGPTLTRAPLAGSPVLDAGDPNDEEVLAAALFDQRGFPYDRIVAGRVDLGAVEVQPTPAYADFDDNFYVDGADFLAWQRGLGLASPDAEKADGDADDDHDVDSGDLAVWQSQFAAPAATASAAIAISSAAEKAAVLDAVFGAGDFTSLFAELSPLRPAKAPRYAPWRALVPLGA